MNDQEFDSFFEVHSQNVDNSNSLGFWQLTDEVLKTYLLDFMPKRSGVTVVDFGGGTGRWLLALDEYFTDSTFIILDKSKDMLAQAQKKADAKLYKNKIQLINGDISNADQVPETTADYIISTYNPISFVDEPQLVINEAFRILKPGGTAMITVQGYYNALYSKVNNFLADASELHDIFAEKKVKWNPDVPKLWQLPKADMESMFRTSGFNSVESRGIACITQPQGEDFDPENKQLGSLSKKLNEDPDFYKSLLKIELEIGRDQNAVDRGMNILTIGKK
jgi:ubiquinone/menaquinone biosynthesis C-methylase UbiE